MQVLIALLPALVCIVMMAVCTVPMVRRRLRTERRRDVSRADAPLD